MGALTPGRPALRLTHEHRLDRRPGLPVLCHQTFRSFRLQPPTVAPTCFWGFLRRAYRTTGFVVALFRGPLRHLGFAIEEQARHDSRPNRVDLRYGLIVHLRLLSTPPRGDAVTVSYEVPEHSGKDLHPADSMHLQAHSSSLRLSPRNEDSAGPFATDFVKGYGIEFPGRRAVMHPHDR